MKISKIVFVIPRMGGGGSERVISILANYYASEHYSVHIIQLINSESFYPLDKQITLSGMNISIRRKNRIISKWDQLRFFLKSLLFIKNEIDNLQPNVIISFMRQTCIIMYLLKCFGMKTRLILSERNDPTVQNIFIRLLMNKIYKKCDVFVCQTQKVADYFNIIDHTVVIPNPIETKNLPNKYTGKRRKVIVSVGRLDKQKNFSLLIHSFDIISVFYPDYILEIYGEGPLRNKLQRLIDRRELKDRIFLMGAYHDILEQIKDATFFILSSNYEGFPNALIEAMAIGLPVISTNFYTGSAQELIGNLNGILVPINDRKAMSTAMCKLLNNKKLREIMSIENIKIAEIYSDTNIINEWKKIIEK